jgi:drug/metabolite transporter (DMT)-like permease
MNTFLASVVFGTTMMATPALAFIIYWQVKRRRPSWAWLVLSAGCALLIANWFWSFVRAGTYLWNWGMGVVAGLTIIAASLACAVVVRVVAQLLARVRGGFDRPQR